MKGLAFPLELFLAANLELEIQNQLLEHSTLEVSEQLLAYVRESENLGPDEIQSIFTFFLKTGSYKTIIHACLENFAIEKFQTPWHLFIEALTLGAYPMDQKILNAIVKGIEESHSELEACRSLRLDRYRQEFVRWRAERHEHYLKETADSKNKLLDQLNYVKSQRLYDQEKKVLSLLFKMFPDDQAIRTLYREHTERYAEEILLRKGRTNRNRNPFREKPDPEYEQVSKAFAESLILRSLEVPSIAYELAVAALVHELYEAGLSIIENCPPGRPRDWLQLELLLGARHHLELLQKLNKVEIQYSDDPETFFATAYYRAQALWGLGQAHTAIEVLESLLESRPSYRSGLSLLSQWRSL